MFNLISSIKYVKTYSKVIYPVSGQRINEYKKYTRRIKKLSMKARAVEALDKSSFDSAVSSVCTLYPGVDVGLAADVVFSFRAIVQYLSSICVHNSANTGPFIRVIFSSLKDALNIRTDSYEDYFAFFPSKDDDGYLNILVEKCRQKVRLLPAFDIVREHIAAFLMLFIDLQVAKYSADDDGKEMNLMGWSSVHGQKYPGLSNWEFCMAIDSPLSIELLLALATSPDLTEERAEKLNSAFFPGVCVVQKILEGYINYNDSIFGSNTNYDFNYKNLKEYEDRIAYFIYNAVKIHYPRSNYLQKVFKILLSIYITHPKADEGMNKITIKALRKEGGRGMFFYTAALKLLRSKNFF